VNNGTADFYRRFAEIEARGVSDIYFDWASRVAGDDEVLALIDPLPGMKRQPNLVFAAARFLGAPVGAYGPFRGWLLDHWDDVAPVILERATQTNEAARCAVLLPVLSRLDGPLSLIEVGASAGLCLYPDRYSYRYASSDTITALDPDDGPSSVTISCDIDRESLPARLPQIVARSGVDLNPLRPDDADNRAWLSALIWPEHDERRRRIDAALDVAAADPPTLIRGDLLDAVPDLIAASPSGAATVVFHSAVLPYVDPDRRQEFVEMMRRTTDVVWISNEGRGVLPSVDAQLTEPPTGSFALAVNEQAVALTGPHGQSYRAMVHLDL
jgi:hypothetical protein